MSGKILNKLPEKKIIGKEFLPKFQKDFPKLFEKKMPKELLNKLYNVLEFT